MDQALSVGINHVGQYYNFIFYASSTNYCYADTAQMYGNEDEVGNAIRESGLSRSQIYVTTKFSGYDTLEGSVNTSLKKVSTYR